ncbi:MarR family winged helix-turn-helix transcriptional regulator [Chloroflexota bacterium]
MVKRGVENDKMKINYDITIGLWQLLNRTGHLVQKVNQRDLNEFGISARGSAILLTISRLGNNATIKGIAQQQYLEHHTVREHLLRMEKAGLVKRIKDLEWKNLVRIEMTDKGYKLCKLIMKKQSVKDVISSLTAEEQKELWYLLSKIREHSMKRLGMKNIRPYPPSDIEEYLSEYSG